MRLRRILVLFTVHCTLFTVLQGCTVLPLRTPAVTPQPLPAQLAAYYDYPRRTPIAEVQPIGARRGFREFLVRFPLSATGFEPTEPAVEFEWFESTSPGRRPGILLNPILGGDYPLERGICRFFARQGFHVALIHRKTLKISPEHDVAHLELLLRQGVLRIRQVVDWMEAHERVDPSKLGSFGVSMGGIAGVMAAAVEPRLRCHVVALAGGGIPEIVLGSPDVLLRKPRERYLAARHLDLATMETLLRQHVTTDPIRLAPYVDARRLLMFIALADRTVGTTNALKLWRALGRPHVVFLPAGHYTAYLYLPYLKFASARFFREQLGTPPNP
ncbi:MAG: hypothetical protein Q8R91_09515 [Candidatus Omnitrophota bacterium]|nr:hypothetical protein [Candidatus Omnitrophota bacterium]